MSQARRRFITDIREGPPADYTARTDANKRISIHVVAAVGGASVQHSSIRYRGVPSPCASC